MIGDPAVGRASAARLGAAIVFGYTVICIATYRWLGDGSWASRLLEPQFYLALPAGAALSAPIVLMALRRQVREPDGSPVRNPIRAWRAAARALGFGRVRYVAVVVALGALFLNAFIAWKSLIPRLHPFAFDASLSQWDFALHGGAPHRFLRWLPISLIDPFYYYCWTIGLVIGILTMAWIRDTRGLLALLLAWILLGSVAATLLSSAGPPYFASVTGLPTPYASLFSHLRSASLGHPAFALEVQRSLWVVYQSSAIVSGTGISAFPSMHVGTATLFALASRPRWLRLITVSYVVVILLGSVALGWHYALDGYAAIVGTCLIWIVTGIGAWDPVRSRPRSGSPPPEGIPAMLPFPAP